MQKLDNIDLIKEYYETAVQDFPDLTFEQCREIVTAPYKQIKEDMEEGNMSVCRLKYLGTFFVYPKKAEASLKSLTKRFKEQKMDAKSYFEIKSKIDKYIEHVKKSYPNKQD